jgi:hypothetical protein
MTVRPPRLTVTRSAWTATSVTRPRIDGTVRRAAYAAADELSRWLVGRSAQPAKGPRLASVQEVAAEVLAGACAVPSATPRGAAAENYGFA